MFTRASTSSRDHRTPKNGFTLTRGAVFGMIAAMGCGEEPKARVCGAPEPAFRLIVRSVEGALPGSLEIEVGFGGAQTETYNVGGESQGDVVCCLSLASLSHLPARIPCAGGEVEQVDQFNFSRQDGAVRVSDAGQHAADADGPSKPELNYVACDLWTNGAAELTVSTEGEQRVQQTLPARQQEESGNCALLQTVDAVLALGESDAGVLLSP